MMIADKLRKSILQAAIQGKLTEQLPTDGNARDLIEKIRVEKLRLIKEKKLKKEFPLPTISDSEIPFDIPDNWCWCRLGDICEIYTGNSISETEKLTKYSGLKIGFEYIATKDSDFTLIGEAETAQIDAKPGVTVTVKGEIDYTYDALSGGKIVIKK